MLSTRASCGGVAYLSSCEILDLIQGLLAGWRTIASMSSVRASTSGILLPYNKTFFVTGGYTGSSTLAAGNMPLGIRRLHASVVLSS